eukprot:15468086-Alexandrium_andersonii.AAC.1
MRDRPTFHLKRTPKGRDARYAPQEGAALCLQPRHLGGGGDRGTDGVQQPREDTCLVDPVLGGPGDPGSPPHRL